MIPSVVASEVLGALRDFLATGFGPSNPALAGVMDDFLADPGNLAKGPYLSIALPFQPAPEGGEPFPKVPLGFTPYRHQRTAFSRLAARSGRSTVVATGTGSGKTECFLYPILDYCRAVSGAKGLKAILIYPMNALANDQARRIAETIHRTPTLRGRVTAGLFVGRDNRPQRSPHTTMGRDHVITDRDTLRDRPPDLLLTNYKMLDYLLVRPFDFRLWRDNEPDTLRYLVVDELHTFDGAQGTDLACLIRRLRMRLRASREKLICAGTSATLGDAGDEAELIDYVSRIFDQPFEPGSVVGEVRQSIDAFLGDAVISRYLYPRPRGDLASCVDPARYGTPEQYLHAQHELFFDVPIEDDFKSETWRLALAGRLREHVAFVNLLRVLDGRPKPMSEVVARLRRSLPVANDREALGVLNGLCALISVARRREGGSDRDGGGMDGGAGGGEGRGVEAPLRPFLQVGLHLWVRELRRMVCSLHEEPPAGSLEQSASLHEDETDASAATPAAKAADVSGASARECSTHDNAVAVIPAEAGIHRHKPSTDAGSGSPSREAVHLPGYEGSSREDAAAGSAGESGRGEAGGRTVAAPRRLRYSDDLQSDEPSIHLPLIQCRECRVTGWGAVKRSAEPRVELDSRVFYNRFFVRDIDVQYLFPAEAPRGVRGVESTICGACGMLQGRGASACAGCRRSGRLVSVFRPDAVVVARDGKAQTRKLSRDCPYCGAREALIILGARAASLLSVALGQACGSRYNDDPRVIAFSDNVQDAAHRGGFFSARTWRNSLRAGVAQVIAAHDGIALADLPERVEAWWSDAGVNPGAFDPERFVSEFIAPDRQWLRDFTALQRDGRLPAGSDLPRLVARRLRWDTLAELGYGSAIGRTLERTRAAAVGVDREALERACNAAHVRIREEFGTLRDLPPAPVHSLALGILRRMKDRGAIRTDLAGAWLARGGGLWWLNRDLALQDFGRRSARPVFPADRAGRGEGLEPLYAGLGGRKSWYQMWVEKVLTPDYPLAATHDAAGLLREVFKALEGEGLIGRLDAGGALAWGLDPARFYATARIAVMRCGAPLGHTLVVPEEEADLWLGVPCLDLGVQASYERHEVEPPTWFGRLYRETAIRRIIAAEHTALLTREERDRLQQRFSDPDPRPWEPNLLSATPTLELGIDIGDLSTVVLCSVPPARTNYLQRIGRAGRRDGNAFSATVATGQPHDLYFYTEPREMLAGRIVPPGVFLNAPAVLERQLTAFCLDGWAATGLAEDAVPRTIRPVLDNVEKARLSGFPYPFLDFAQQRGNASHRYLLLYDTIPSGTGYLKDLMTEPERLFEVFRMARGALRSCSCNQDPLKDGCYRCVFAYRRSREMAGTSRDTALEILEGILAREKDLVEVENLGGVKIDTLLESELEARFIEALRRIEIDGRAAPEVRADLVRGRPGYVMKLGERTSYFMEPQAELGESDGVAEPCRPDFLIRPARLAHDRPPVAVFMDGFEFHREATDVDSLKRMVLVRAGFLVWSLTWHDLEAAFGNASDAPDFFAGARTSNDMVGVQRELDERWGTGALRSRLDEPALTQLVRYLAEPEPERWKRAVFTELFCLFERARMRSDALRASFEAAVTAELAGPVREAMDELPPPIAVAGRGAWIGTAPASADVFAALPLCAVERGDPDAAAVVVHLHDDPESREGADYRRTWNGVLRLVNLLQFLPGAWWTTRRGVERGLYPEFAPVPSTEAAVLVVSGAGYGPSEAEEKGIMAWRTPERRILTVSQIGTRKRTRGGNYYLECLTDAGVTAFWGSEGNLNNLRLIEGRRTPFRLGCGCIPSNWPTQTLWVPEGSRVEILDTPSPGPLDDGPEEAVGLAASEVRPLLTELLSAGVPVPEVGFELCDDAGRVLAETELAWPEHEVAILLPNQEAHAAAFEQAGWRVFTSDAGDLADLAEAVSTALAGEE